MRLIRIQRETDDAVTLTFSLPQGKALQSSPGQFLTFNWIVNGQTLPRSYSISSVPSRVGSFDVTVKKQGIVSTFLNESAREGLTVVANGPYGRFVFDLSERRTPVFFAAGSGITPILSMLRHIEENSPACEVTLFYVSRDDRQIIFKADLDRLATSLTKFYFVPIVTRPSAEWVGERGQLTKEIVLKTMPSVEGKTFFLSGPAGYMTAVNAILTSLGVGANQIHQERFAPSAVAYHRRDLQRALENRAVLQGPQAKSDCEELRRYQRKRTPHPDLDSLDRPAPAEMAAPPLQGRLVSVQSGVDAAAEPVCAFGESA